MTFSKKNKMSKQRTILKSVSLKGVGIHSGNEVNLTFKPAAEDFGYAFCRTDLPSKPIIEADVNYVVSTKRGTTLEKDGITIQTSEHVLAALVGMEVDNVLIEIDASEPPIMDGSSKYFVEAIINAGIKEQTKERNEYIVKDVISYYDEESGSDITIIPSKYYEVTAMVDFGTKILGTQNATMKRLTQFKDEFADSRTFSFLHEIEMLLENGLIKGGDLNNAIVYVDKELSSKTMEKLKKAFNKDKISVKSNGILDNLTLHYPNEARVLCKDLAILVNTWGGILGIEYALKYQQNLKALIVSNMVPSVPDYNDYAKNVLALKLDPEILKEIRSYEAVEDYTNETYLKLIHDNYYPEHVLRIPAEDWPEDVSNAFAEINFPIYLKMQGPSEFGIVGNASLKDWDVTQELNKINVPFLSIGAEHDTMDPKQMEWMANEVQNGSYLHCPNGSHMAMWLSLIHI